MTGLSITRAALGAAFVLCLSQITASAEFLSSGEIKSLIGGKRVHLATSYGIEFPLRYANNGRVTGDGSGTTLGKYMAPKETGNWWVSGNRMCQKFPTWYDGQSHCFRLKRTGASSLEWVRDDGYKGTARISG